LEIDHCEAVDMSRVSFLTHGVYVLIIDPPSKPGRPAVVDYDRDLAEIHWSPSQHDGGSPILKYLIEKRELPDQTWHTVTFYSYLLMIFLISADHFIDHINCV